MKNLFIISEEEKERILKIHESATKRQYLKEDNTNNQSNVLTITDNDRTYDYQKNGDTYFFKVKQNATDKRAQKYKDGNWHQAIGQKATSAIKALFDKKFSKTQPNVQTVAKPVTNTDPSKAAIETSKISQSTPQTSTVNSTQQTGNVNVTKPVTNTTQQPSTKTGTIPMDITDIVVT